MAGSLQGIFNTSVQGMNAQTQALNVVSTNITNVATTGYKAEDNHFETLLNHTTSSNGNVQKFFAVKNNNSQDVDKQGQIITTNRTMDLALNGKGLIVTQNSAGTYQYTRDGAFYGQSVKATATTPEHTILTTVAGNNVLGWKANADGTFTETDSLASLVPVEIATQGTFPAQATSTINLQANLSAGSEGRQTVALPFVDESGASQTLTLGFTRDQTTNYTLDGVTSSGATISFASDQVTFDSFGNIATPSGGLVQATINDPLGPQNVTIDLSRMTSLADKGGIVVQQVDQDGYIAGTLSNTYFTSNGVLMGSYSNHELRPLYKLAVANFTNNDGLVQLPGNVFVESNFLPGDQGKGAGALKLTGLGSGTIGTQFITGALEGSTVDLSDQFAKMIITQRCYSSSAKVLQVADEMTQAVRDLKR